MSSALPLAGAHPLLGPLVGLVSWTFVMETWMYALRLPAMEKYKVDVHPGMTKGDMNSKLPASVRWPADNYDHLHEQPTVFYAIIFALDRLGMQDTLTVRLAWTYVALRIVHSLVQASTNAIMVRFSLFAASSVTLVGLTGLAGRAFF
ncbi:hypothetical protein LTR62_000148 [Meristemomyces frigidus]|uniref:MAPEG family protein n=1 Tax=Meristemomyces frigidus TaxID=1508187 RepID=A0AAN7TQC4_9PEZI|nr:hypothetical protein LTR62_000148 [Meristemomyces frigidus]